MTKPKFSNEQQTNIDITISLSLLNTLSYTLVENPPYPLSHGLEDPLTQHMIDIYNLKKGILRALMFVLFVVTLWRRFTRINEMRVMYLLFT
jgi:hypothetical protein